MKIGLALSGGGNRAVIFHLGVLKRLAEENLLEKVTGISTVSGGSLAVAVLLSHAEMKWPSSITYIKEVYPALRSLITEKDLLSFKSVGWSGVLKNNIRLFTDRARILAEQLQSRWGVVAKLSDLPDCPEIWINSTCYETGKNWRFSKREMGDWKFGRHYNPPFSLAEAAASSASVPYVIGALSIELPLEGWWRSDPASREPQDKIQPTHKVIHLWDGGAYENLGLEAMYKPRELRGCDYLISSDASAPLGNPENFKLSKFITGELCAPRLFDIAGDQIRALRSRMFIGDMEKGHIQGALFRMGNSVREIDIKAGCKRDKNYYDDFLSEDEVAIALAQPTGLSALSCIDFDRIARHGYEVANAILTTYSPDCFDNSFRWRDIC